MLRRSLSLMAVFTLSPLLLDGSSVPDTRRNAICILYPEKSKVSGTVSFSQEALEAPTKIACMVQGLNPKANHGFHIHEFGDLTEGCTTAGPHYNPQNSTHGGPGSTKRHVGDLGNLTADDNGVANICFTDKIISLYGDQSVVGRAVVVHANEDDLGKTDHPESSKTGNSGPRIACGVIGLSKEFRSPEQKDNQKSKDQEAEKGGEKGGEKEKGSEKDKGGEKEKGSEKDKGAEKEKESEKDKGAKKEKVKEGDKEMGKDEKGKDKSGKQKQKGKDGDKEKEKDEKGKDQSGKQKQKGKDGDKEKDEKGKDKSSKQKQKGKEGDKEKEKK